MAMENQKVLEHHFGESSDFLLRESWKALQRIVSEYYILKKPQEVQYEYYVKDCSKMQARPDTDNYAAEFGLLLRTIGSSWMILRWVVM